MLSHILSRTPIYVWVILAVILYFGVRASRAREVSARTLLVIPFIMLALALQDMASKFGLHAAAFAAWALGAAASAALVYRFARTRVDGVTAAGAVRLRGSWATLGMMLAVFLTKYTVAVTLAVQPALQHELPAIATVCALFGALNGYFLGRMLRDLAACRQLAGRQSPALA